MGKVYREMWGVEELIVLEAGGYQAKIIPSVGANAIALKSVDKNISILRQIEDIEDFKAAPGVYGTPLLFPPNRIDAGTFEVRNMRYQFEINEPNHNNSLHGFLADRPFEIDEIKISEEKDQVYVSLVFIADESTSFYQYFPHKFTCRLIHILSSEGLKQIVKIENNDNKAMPVGVGYHTAINLNFVEGYSAKDVKLVMSVGERIELNDRALPTGRYIELNEDEKLMRNSGQSPMFKELDDHYTVDALYMEDGSFHGAILENYATGNQIIYEAGEKFKHWMLWNCGKEGSFICPEPQTWLVNAPNSDLPDEKTGMIILETGEVFEEYTKLSCR
ncbi:aldose 1-epimerase [Vallitalea okinawensis]|uniref:aldose 1-epimerase n=1 Tax=Vallitalea okinawensis TaxID=2078660 RepID=UPI000CFB1A57|nr:aldose 1-epimerase [Vallitalea okinawensis]